MRLSSLQLANSCKLVKPSVLIKLFRSQDNLRTKIENLVHLYYNQIVSKGSSMWASFNHMALYFDIDQ